MSAGVKSFRERLRSKPAVMAPGVFDPLSALLAEQAGFEALFLSGSALAYSSLGRPDVGLVTATELADVAARISDRVNIPLLVDADTGFGNAAHVARTVRLLDHAGAAAIQIEDQITVKSPDGLTQRPLVSKEEMVGKIKAAQDARTRDTLLISARSDAVVSVGFDEALRRGEAYLDAGCDLLFLEGLTTADELAEAGRLFGARAPLVHNQFLGGRSPLASHADAERYGLALILYSGAVVATMAKAASEMLVRFRRTGSLAEEAGTMFDNAALTDLIGMPGFLASAARYRG
jgi:2-methylisocitrate lyase-like PEP mutase family enzyme